MRSLIESGRLGLAVELPRRLSLLVIVVAVFAVANMISLEATLSFPEPDAITWGRMLTGGRLCPTTAWWRAAERSALRRP
jgi:ABC-type dipeptide/oligopeptide/nickel transport system permease subunit